MMTNTQLHEEYESSFIPVQPEEPKKTHRGKTGRIIALALCCSLIGGAVGAGGFAVCSKVFNEQTDSSEIAEDAATVLQGQRERTAWNVSYVDTGSEMTASKIYAANVNSTVGITTSVTTNYFGFQTTAAASGSVSALNREVTINNTAMNLIQTDCAINSGNSGGALFNTHGEVVSGSPMQSIPAAVLPGRLPSIILVLLFRSTASWRS